MMENLIGVRVLDGEGKPNGVIIDQMDGVCLVRRTGDSYNPMGEDNHYLQKPQYLILDDSWE